MPGIRTPAQLARHIEEFQEIIFLQQGGKNHHEPICENLALLAAEVVPRIKASRAQRKAEKVEALAPHMEHGLERERWMAPLAEADVPVAPAARERKAYYRK